MIIVMRTVVGFPAARGGIELVPKRGCPFLPCEISLLRELHRERECLSLPRLGKHRLPLPPATAAAALARLSNSGIGSGWLKVVVPQIEIDGIVRRGLLAPQLARGEAH